MALKKYFQDIVDDVQKHGWYSVFVVTGEHEPSFGYSVGFWESLNAPDVIIFGLPSKLTHSMLFELSRQLKSGRKLADGVRWPGLIAGYDCVSRRVHPSQTPKYLLSAIWYRNYRQGRDDIESYQIFWPGKGDGLFPWEAGCSDYVRESQPALYLPREGEPSQY
jgi:hypothetical protein